MTKVIETHPELEELLKEFKTETVAEEALRILEPTPEDLWFMGSYDSACGKKHCAIGWIGVAKKRKYSMDHPKIAYMAHEFLNPKETPIADLSGLARVNDGVDKRYPQPSPKQRVIALLSDMIKAGY